MIPFLKMHGLGNDFVIIDQRKQRYQFDVKNVSNRRLGIGCDQLIIIEESVNADCRMRIYNPDGGEAGACGNATRCVAYVIIKEKKTNEVKIAVKNKILKCWKAENNLIKVDMGKPSLKWEEIPLAESCDTTNLPISYGELKKPMAVNMGNPHVIFFVQNINSIDLQVIGPKIEKDPLFPERVNVNIAQIQNGKILLKVWERGAGETLACGSGACATLVAAIKQKQIAKRSCIISLPGGELIVEWKETVFMTGPIKEVFTGFLK